MTHCIAAEYAKKGIRVNNLNPGLIATEMIISPPSFPQAEPALRLNVLMPHCIFFRTNLPTPAEHRCF